GLEVVEQATTADVDRGMGFAHDAEPDDALCGHDSLLEVVQLPLGHNCDVVAMDGEVADVADLLILASCQRPVGFGEGDGLHSSPPLTIGDGPSIGSGPANTSRMMKQATASAISPREGKGFMGS